ncbi:MAG: tetratricopeptide repeat protein [Actinomycetota bacterium]|nr:tetratricopeptide repeat protein [Actinomycetota bacterium]
MSETSQSSRGGPERGGQRGRAVLVLVLAVLAGLGLGRFLSYDGAVGAPAPAPAVAAARGDLASEAAALEAAVARDPADLRSLQALGAVHIARAAETGDPSYYGSARSAFDRADAVVRDDPETLLGRGLLALALHEFDAAEELGERALRARPDNPSVLGVLVDAQVEQGRYEEAAATLQAMLDQRPALPALARTSYVRQLHGDLDGAVLAMEQARAAGSPRPYDRAVVSTLLGDLYLQRGDLDAAGDAYDEALRDAPGLVNAGVGRARVLEARGDTAAAVRLLQDVTERQPAPAPLLLLADLQASTGDASGAASTRELVRAIAGLQESAGQVVDLEMALFEADTGDPERAVERARRAHAARPDNVFTQDALAWALHRAGRSAEALPLAQQALRLGTAEPSLRYRAASVLAANGEREAAAAALRGMTGARWFSVAYRADAAALAADLGVPAPAEWTSPVS